jgi:AAA domain/UvrD-like helicase C-terminal domain
VARLAIARGFLAEYAQLDKGTQVAVRAMITQFASPGDVGQYLETPQDSWDYRIRVVQVDSLWCGVVLALQGGDTYCLITMLPRDEAYAYASSHRFGVNRVLGVLEIYDEEAIERLAAALRTDAGPEDERLYADITNADLIRLGVDPQILPLVRLLSSEADLESLQAALPEAQYAALYALACGMTLEQARAEVAQLDLADAPPDQVDLYDLNSAIDRTPGEMALISGRDELQGILAHPFAAWRIFLHPSQRRIAYRPSYSGPAQVTGGPGTGKTVTALHRAAFLAARCNALPEASGSEVLRQESSAQISAKPVLLTTLAGNLADVLSTQLDLLIPDSEVRSRIDVLNVDRLAYSIVKQARGNPVIADERVLRTWWAKVAADAGLMYTPAFLKNEWEQVILAQDLRTEQAYLACLRTGRGRPLSRSQRSQVWQLTEHITAELAAAHQSTHIQLANEATCLLRQAGSPRYRHVIVDEGQDLHPAQWRLLRAAVPVGPDDLFIAADPHQRIYDNRVSLASLSINVRGRSRRLSMNYRTTQEILSWAVPLLGPDPATGLDGEVDSLLGYRSPMHGDPPQVRFATSRAQEFAFLAERVRAWLDAGMEPHAIGVAARLASLAREAREHLQAVGITASSLSSRASGQAVRVGTMHAMKGLEFEAVAVIGVGQEEVPAPDAVTPANEDAVSNAQDMQRERCVLFVACTRARDHLYVSCTGQPSEFLPPPTPSIILAAADAELGEGIVEAPDLVLTRKPARDQYLRWNQALADVVFTKESAGRPVYLDMDDDVVRLAADRVGAEAPLAVSQLTCAVRGTLRLDGPGGIFDSHLLDLRMWREGLKREGPGQQIPPPPVIALLAVFTLAAEFMGADSTFAANAYYPRLCELLHIGDRRQARWLESAYRNCAEQLWRGLTDWLVSTDGQFGLPSAFALSHRYVGLPMSQALVRGADRRRLPLMFHRYGLPPGSEVSPADMERLLDDWISQIPCPVTASLQALWAQGHARERIATVASVELLAWNGSLLEADEGEDHEQRGGDILLVALVRHFPRAQLDLSFVADLRTLPSPRSLTVASAPGEPSIDMIPAVGSRVQPNRVTDIDPESLLEGFLHLTDKASDRNAYRRPRRVVPLRRDELLNAYVESERLQLAEDAMLLVKTDRDLPAAVREMLEQTARPGFNEVSTLPGLPPGWTAFLDVQVMRSPAAEPKYTDLNSLVPLLSSQLTLAGGLKLPGHVRKWSSLDPPEVRAVLQDSEAITVSLASLAEGSGKVEPRRWTSNDAMIVAELADLDLPDGDYEISLANARAVRHQTILRLRSSDTPDMAGWRSTPKLVHDLNAGPMAVVSAVSLASSSERFVNGPYTTGPDQSVQDRPCPASAWWGNPKREASPKHRVVLALPDPKACVVTGAHRIQLPTFYGRATSQLVTGVCEGCGLVKRYPAWYSRRRFTEWHAVDQPGPRTSAGIDVSRLPGIRQITAEWDMGLDALIHVGGGPLHSLERVALQIDGSRLFVDDFMRSLEAHGDLEIKRGEMLQPDEWEMSPAYLAELTSGDYLLTGCWSRHARNELTERAERVGGEVRAIKETRGLTIYLLHGLAANQVQTIAAAAGVQIALAACLRMLRALPPLSHLEAALPRVPMPGARRILRFDVKSASWEPTLHAAEPGAYRLETEFTTTDVFRSINDIAQDRAALGTPQLTKHLAARLDGRPLIACDIERTQLVVPLGADLPGLYGRAAVLASGRLPTPVPERRSLVYHAIDRPMADRLAGLLTS